MLGLSAGLLAGCSVAGRRPSPPPAAPAPEQVPQPAATDSGEVVPKFEPRSAHGNPPFYSVLGKRYVVMGSADGYVERGVASWYGPTFHGENTSNGERYDMYAMTAAHKTLPLPTYVRVTNLKNGRTVVVRINDRGPFVANRLIDLSYSAASKLDMLREGTTLVEVRAITPLDPDRLTRASQSPPPTLYVQAGAFADQSNATKMAGRLHANGISSAFVAPRLDGNAPLYRVRIGPINNVAEFDRLAAKLATLGYHGARLAND